MLGNRCASARGTAHEIWPTAGLSHELSQDLPTWTYFEDAVATVTEQDATKSTPCGPDVEPYVESVRSYLDVDYDHLYFHRIGPDQVGRAVPSGR